jgi:hypothetical protein
MKHTTRRRLVLLWLLIPVGLLAFHFGPGTRYAQRETAATLVRQARAAGQSQDWAAAVALYAQAMQTLPPEAADDRILLGVAHADARIYLGELPEALAELEELLRTAPVQQPAVAAHLRAALAEAEYYTAWLMRLEGAEPDEWNVEAASARQHFRFLAETHSAASTAGIGVYHTNLEASIRLALMDDAQLKALPLPAKIGNCENVSQKIRKQRATQQSQQKEASEGEERGQDARDAGLGERPEETGS